jgi:hypothetical protein
MEVMYVHRWIETNFPVKEYPYEDRLIEVSDNIRNWFDESNFLGEKTGLYLATSNAGIRESIDFWKHALEHSPRFANPSNFNWTLSNGPASLLSRKLGIKGPCHTLIGKSKAMKGCLFHAYEDLGSGIMDLAMVAGLDIFVNVANINICLISKSKDSNKINLDDILEMEDDTDSASAFLSLIMASH